MTDFITQLESWFATTEQDVITLIAKIKADLQIAEADVTSALSWLSSEVPTIVAALQTALGFAEAVGVVSAPELIAAQAAVSALQAFATAQTSSDGTLVSDGKAVIAGYVAYQQAQATVASAKAITAQAAAVGASK